MCSLDGRGVKTRILEGRQNLDLAWPRQQICTQLATGLNNDSMCVGSVIWLIRFDKMIKLHKPESY